MGRSLVASIRKRQQQGYMPVLAEIKVRSPKEGDLLRGRDPVALAQLMTSCPLAGLSVVTEARDFGGDLALIRQVRPHVDVPILCKDFHRQPDQLAAAAAAGADVVLLIMAMLSDVQIATLHQSAHELGLETLIETHSASELARLAHLDLQPDLLGINNRDISVLEIDGGDVSLTEQLARNKPNGALLISESSLRGPEDVCRARNSGADAVLVGTAILTAANPGEAIQALIGVGWQA